MSKGKWDVRSRLSAERNKLSLDGSFHEFLVNGYFLLFDN